MFVFIRQSPAVKTPDKYNAAYRLPEKVEFLFYLIVPAASFIYSLKSKNICVYSFVCRVLRWNIWPYTAWTTCWSSSWSSRRKRKRKKKKRKTHIQVRRSAPCFFRESKLDAWKREECERVCHQESWTMKSQQKCTETEVTSWTWTRSHN